MLGRHRTDRGRVSRNGVPALAALEGDQPERRDGECLAQHASEHLDRVRAAAGDVGAGMPAETAAHSHRQRHRARVARLPRLLNADRRVGATRRADGQLPVFFAVEVHQRRPADKARVEPARAFIRAADLLVDRHQQLQRTVWQRLVLGQRHHRGDADAVVRAERRPVGGQPVAVADKRRSCPRPDRTGCPGDARRPCPDAPAGREPGPPHDPPSPARARRGCGRRPGEGRSRARRPSGERARSTALLVTRRARDLGQRLEVPPARAGLDPAQYRALGRHRGSLAVRGRCARRRSSCRAMPTSSPRWCFGPRAYAIRPMTRSAAARISSHSMPRRI